MPVTRRDFVANSALSAAWFAAPPHHAIANAGTGAAVDEQRATADAPEQIITRMIAGFQLTQLVYVAAKLRIADHLAKGPQDVAQLAAATESNADALYRVLRALAGLGVFAEDEGRRFRLTPAGELLRTGVPGSLRGNAESRGEDWSWRAWGALLQSVRTGTTGFDLVYGKNTFDWFAENPEAARIFDELQADVTRRTANPVAAAYNFSTARTIVDVGGGNGTLLTAILRRHPTPRGILFDLPHVVDAARPGLDPAVKDRCELVGGDFFKAVPSGGDLYVMKYILHDWEESRALAILATLHRAMRPEARLLVVEDLVCGPNVPCAAKIQDVQMLVRTGGKNRTEREYRELLRAGRFETVRVVPASGDLALIETRPV